MSKPNGHADVRVEEEKQAAAVTEPELPAADPNDGFTEQPSTPSASGGSSPQSVAEPVGATDELQKLRAERDGLFDRLARLQAEFDNYRKRAGKENADFRDYAVSEAARSMLPVVDSFALALKNTAISLDDFRKGVELIYKQLQEALQKMNVQRVPAQGEPFDPRVHEAIEMVESDQVPDNHVLDELQAGYRIKERLLRPAMVRVAKNVSKKSE